MSSSCLESGSGVILLNVNRLNETVKRHIDGLWSSGVDGISIDGEQLEIQYMMAWELSDEMLSGLDIFRLTSSICLKESGIPGGSRYQWSIEWPVGGVPDGVWLQAGNRRYLLPPEIIELQELCSRVKGANKVTVFRAMIRLQRLASRCSLIQLPERITKSRVREASQVRIEVDQQGVPVPQLVEVIEESSSSALESINDSPHRSHSPDWSLITPAASVHGVISVAPKELIRNIVTQASADSVEKVGQEYVILPKEVFQNLVMTAAAAQQPAKVRHRFLENPTAFLPAPEAFDEANYSARVVGVGEAPRGSVREGAEPRSWADQTPGLLIELPSHPPFWVEGDALQHLADALRAAAARGETSLDWEGAQIPCRADVVEAISRAASPHVQGAGDVAEDEPPDRPRVLRIRENELELEWAPERDEWRQAMMLMFPALQPNVTLKPHQEQALSQLRTLWMKGDTGALLCDDMGLGKTMQALVFAAWVAHQLRAGGGCPARERVVLPIMIVAPPSLLEGWLSELRRRLPDDQLCRVVWGASSLPGHHHGREIRLLSSFRKDQTNSGGSQTVVEHARLDLAKLQAFSPDILFIGYDTLRSLQFAVGEVRMGLIIADEAQQVKNPTSLRSHALRAMNYDFALVLTGTPIENSWSDLWTLCDFAVPGLLGTLSEFRAAFPTSGPVREVGERLAKKLRNVLIRRTRGTALKGLPPCDIRSIQRAMPFGQALAYRAEIAHSVGAGGSAVLGLLQGLARVSLHPQVRVDLRSSAEAQEWLRASARTVVLLEALQRWQREDEAVIVFVRSLAAQQTLQRALRLTFQLPDVEILNGQISMPERQRVVQRFEQGSGFRILLVSPDVGGAGWNLQFAARSFLLERPFNPAIEAQMIARTWRLGQDRPVEVIAPVATLDGIETFDQVLDQLLQDKRELAESVLAPAVVENEEIVQRFSRLVSGQAL